MGERHFLALKEYKEKNGRDKDPPKSYKVEDGEGELNLGKWCGKQRHKYKKKQLSAERIRRLKDIGFQWEPDAAFWERHFRALEEYKRKNGRDKDPPTSYKVEDGEGELLNLGTWCSTQRHKYKKKGARRLSAERIKRLEDIGFQWDDHAASWERHFLALKEYKEKNGRGKDPPESCKVEDGEGELLNLGTWCNTQRRKYKKKQLSAERIRRLESIGF